jgi:ribonuclease G
MKNQIIIHASGKQTRIALLENNELAQLFIESPENQRTVGDIYLAEVRKVMGGIRAAFIDMNTPKDAFLHYSDLGEHLDDYLVMLNGKGALPDDAAKKLREFRDKKDDSQNTKNGTNAEEQNLLGNLLKPGHKLLVQIVKEPIGSKGPRVSTNISIAGRFLVLIPMGDYVAVSKRIRSYKERRSLRQTVAEILPEGFGVIVRTVAEGQNPKMIENDLKDVLEKWNNIVKNLESAKPPTLLHRDLEMTESLVRDLFAKDFDRILVDDSKMFKTLKNYVSRIAPNMLPNIQLYKGSTHIFDHMNIMQDVESVFSPRVKMPSGGYLIFEQTEAMYVVDVNSGRYAAKKAQEDNSLKTNLESAREIAKQLRLRDIGGIIVVDFIDLREEVNRKKVYDELKKEFRKDRAKTNVLPMSDFGLVQITRQRIRPSVVKSVSRVCPMCGGSGSIVSQNTILSDIESWLSKFRHTTTFRSVDLHINPYMRGMITKGWISQHFKWMLKFRLRIGLVEDISLSMNDYKFTLSGSDVDITETIMMDESIEAAIKAAERSIAEMESEHKRDSTTLDIYKKEKQPHGKPDQGRDRNQPSRDRDQDENRDQRQARNQSPSGRSAISNSTDTRRVQNQPAIRDSENKGRNTPTDNQPKLQGITPVVTVKSEPLQSNSINKKETTDPTQRRNQKISKYYKKQDDADRDDSETEETSAVESVASNKQKDGNVIKSNSLADNNIKDISNVNNAGKPDVARSAEGDIPDELSHLRSAWEVAREYKIKRDKEKSDVISTPDIKNPIDSQVSEESDSNQVNSSEVSVNNSQSDSDNSEKISPETAKNIVTALVQSPRVKNTSRKSDSQADPSKSGAETESSASKNENTENLTDDSKIIGDAINAEEVEKTDINPESNESSTHKSGKRTGDPAKKSNKKRNITDQPDVIIKSDPDNTEQ